MAVDQSVTPLPVQDFVPILVEVGDWHDLDANSSATVLETSRFGDQVVDIHKVGGRPETSVSVEIEATFTDERGQTTETQRYESTAFGNFNNPIETGPVATDRLEWRTVNRSATNFTDALGTPYQTFVGYSIRRMTVIEKLRRNIPLNEGERRLAQRVFPGESLSILDQHELNIPPLVDPAYQPNLEGKNVVRAEAQATTVNLSGTGTGNAVDIVDETTDRDPTTGTRADVLYLTSIGINGQEFDENDGLNLRILRDTTEEFGEVKTFGVPGIGQGSAAITTEAGNTVDGAAFPAYEMDFFVPFFKRMTVQVYADGNAVNNIDVRAEFARVERTLVEKAIYGLESEVRTDDDLAELREQLFQQIRDKIRVGLPIEVERQQTAEQLAAPPGV